MNAFAVVRQLLEEETKRFVGIVVLRRPENPEVLIIKRDGPPEEGKWACPGGHVDAGEEDKDAAYRELEEETGIEADSMHQFEHDDVQIGHLVFFWTLVDDNTKAKAMDDAEKAKWVSVDNLPELAWENERQIKEAVKLALDRQ